MLIKKNNTFYSKFLLPSLENGTRPLADIFWLCDDNQQVKVTLPTHWTGICAPVMLTGQVTVIGGRNKKARTKRGLQKPWQADNNIYIAWNQEPIGVPDEHRAVGESWIQSRQGTGWIPLIRASVQLTICST